MHEEIGLDDLLKSQETAGDTATVEAIEGDDSSVRVTPYAPGAGCACDFAITVPKDAIASLARTGEVHPCCGHLLNVVVVTFAVPVLTEVFRQLSGRARRRTAQGATAGGRLPAIRVEPAAVRGAAANRALRRNDPRDRTGDPNTWVVDAINQAFERFNECISRPGLDGFDLCLCQNALSADLFALGQGDGVQMICPPPGTPKF